MIACCNARMAALLQTLSILLSARLVNPAASTPGFGRLRSRRRRSQRNYPLPTHQDHAPCSSPVQTTFPRPLVVPWHCIVWSVGALIPQIIGFSVLAGLHVRVPAIGSTGVARQQWQRRARRRLICRRARPASRRRKPTKQLPMSCSKVGRGCGDCCRPPAGVRGGRSAAPASFSSRRHWGASRAPLLHPVCRAAKHYAAAVDGYSKAIELRPDCAIYLSNRAFAHAKLEEYGSAIEDASESIRIDPTYVKVGQQRGLAGWPGRCSQPRRPRRRRARQGGGLHGPAAAARGCQH